MWFFDTSGFPARWHCGQWPASLGWVHILSDLATWAAYVSIPLVIAYFLLNARDVPFPRVAWLFGAFIFSCGTVHLIEAMIFWWPVYRLAGAVKLGTALVSWATVLALIPITPKLIARPSLEELRREIARREELEGELLAAKEQLEQRVAERTRELERANASLAHYAAIRA